MRVESDDFHTDNSQNSEGERIPGLLICKVLRFGSIPTTFLFLFFGLFVKFSNITYGLASTDPEFSMKNIYNCIQTSKTDDWLTWITL